MVGHWVVGIAAIGVANPTMLWGLAVAIFLVRLGASINKGIVQVESIGCGLLQLVVQQAAASVAQLFVGTLLSRWAVNGFSALWGYHVQGAYNYNPVLAEGEAQELVMGTASCSTVWAVITTVPVIVSIILRRAFG